MSDLESNRTTKSQNLLNIVKGLKRKRAERGSLPKITEERIEPVSTIPVREDLSIGINDKTNYAPPGYMVWNYYYDTPLQKIPNDTEIKVKTSPTFGKIIGFRDKIYKVLIGEKILETREDEFTLRDESKREHYNVVHIANMKYNELHPPTKSLEPLDLLQFNKRLELDTENHDKIVEKVVEIEDEDEDVGENRYSVKLCVIRSTANYKMGFRYRVWNLYVASTDKSKLIFYDTLLIERGIDERFADGYIKFYWAHANGKPSLVPVEQLPRSIEFVPDFRESVEFIKTTRPLSFRQDGGGIDNVVNDEVKDIKNEIVDIPELIDNKYKRGDNYDVSITQTYQPYPTRKSHAAAELRVSTRDPDIRKKYKRLFGKYEFVDRENYFGYIYKHGKYIIIKKGFNTTLDKVDVSDYETLQIYEDNYGECDEDTQCYWFIAKELEPNEFKTENKLETDNVSIVSRVREVGDKIHNFFTGVRDKISQITERSEDVDGKNDEIINRYFSDDESETSEVEPLIRYKPIFYASAIHPTNSIPLNHRWYLVDALNLDRDVEIPLDVVEEITDPMRIMMSLNNNKFLLLPWSLDELTDYTLEERNILTRPEDKPEIEMNSRVRIIKDFGYSGFNIRYFTGIVTSIRRDKGITLYNIELDFPFITDEDIVVDETFIELVGPENNLDLYFNALENTQTELSNISACPYDSYKALVRERIEENNNEIDKLLLSSNLYEYFKNYLEHMVMNPGSVIQFNFVNVSDDEVRATVDLPIELLIIDPFIKPVVKSHILDRIIAVCDSVCKNECLEHNYKCVIEDNWPPNIGDTVVIAEGLHKGKRGVIMDIKSGLNVSSNGEATLKIGGIRSPYTITMNYLLNAIDTTLKPIRYDGYLRLSLIFTKTRGHSSVDVVEYDNLMKGEIHGDYINVGDYVRLTGGKYKGKILQVVEVDTDERIEPGYYVAERAGTPMIMTDGRKNVLRSGLQYRIRAVTADLYKLTGQREKNREFVLVYSPFNKNVSECELLDRDAALGIIDKSTPVVDEDNPLNRLELLVKHRRRR